MPLALPSPIYRRVETPRTIIEALAPHALEPHEYSEYHAYLEMTKRFLGEHPSFYPTLCLAPAAIRTHVGLFARMFHAPGVDMRLPGFLSPRLRRLAFITASAAFDCAYCTAHAFCFGDMLRGSVPSQVKRGSGSQAQVPLDPESDVLTKAESCVVRYATAAVRRPFYEEPEGSTLKELADDLKALVGARGLEIVKAVVAFSGALNTVMDVQGVTLEAEVQNFTVQHLPTMDGEAWEPCDHHWNPTVEANEPFEGERPELLGIPGKVANIAELAATMPAACSGMKYEMFTLYEGIPYRTSKLNTWVEDRIGPVGAHFFTNMRGTELKRAFCFGLRENLLVQKTASQKSASPREWKLSQRLCFLYVFARVTGSSTLLDVAISIMPVCTDENGRRRHAVRQLNDFAECQADMMFSDMAAARRLVVAGATRMDNIGADVVYDLVRACSPQAIMELASMLSFFEMWRRLDLLFADDDDESLYSLSTQPSSETEFKT